jgi:predicted transcriptional regulator
MLIAQNPGMRIRDLADIADITERSAHAIVRDLEQEGYLSKTKVGRRNEYSVNQHQPFRHPAEAGHEVGELMTVFSDLENKGHIRTAGSR